jgi:EmrB/QacA subfamily drug resistance transporter
MDRTAIEASMTGAAAQPPLGRSLTVPRATVLVAALATFMALMDAQIVNVALPTITRHFASTLSSTQWLISAYALGLAAAMPASGWFGDRFGTKHVIVFATVAFTVGSACCAVAPSLPLLIAARVLQALGGGMLIPVTLAMMYRAHPPAERISAATAMTTISMIAPATAPLIGGLIITETSWRWIFFINVPIGVLALWLAISYLDEYRGEPNTRLDIPGFVLGPVAIALMLYAISEGPIIGWGSPRVWVLGVLGVGVFASFVYLEMHRRAPLLNVRLLIRERLFRVCCLLQLIQPIVFGSSLIYTSLYIQETRGLSALTSGSATCPEAVAIWCFSRVVRRLYRPVGPRRLVGIGFVLYIVGTIMLSRVGAETNLWLIRGWTFLLGIGTSFVALPLRTAAYTRIDSAETGHATAIFSTAQRAGQAIGVAVLGSVLAIAAGNTLHPHVTAFVAVFLAAATVALLGLIVTMWIPDREAASTRSVASL